MKKLIFAALISLLVISCDSNNSKSDVDLRRIQVHYNSAIDDYIELVRNDIYILALMMSGVECVSIEDCRSYVWEQVQVDNKIDSLSQDFYDKYGEDEWNKMSLSLSEIRSQRFKGTN